MIQNSSPRIDDDTHIQKNSWRSVSKYVGRFVVFVVLVSQCSGLDEPKQSVQQRMTAICHNLQMATVRVRSGTDTSSGVIVSKSGLVLTVAHGLKPGSDTATVVFSNGKTSNAERVLVDNQADVALLLMDDASSNEVDWNTLVVSVIEDSVVGEVVVANGFPARELDGMGSVVRLGEILAIDRAEVKTSCTLTSGDSGGPVVNSYGELIGLHRLIGGGTQSNVHITLTAIRAALEKSKYRKILTPHCSARAGTKLSSNDLMASPQVVMAASRATVAIQGTTVDSKSAVKILGTVLDDYHVATKLSEIVPYHVLECQFADGSMIAATLSKFDQTLDLAILKLTSPYEDGEALNAAYSGQQNAVSFRSQIVFAATGLTDISAAGMVGRVGHNEPALPARFGATMQANADRVLITELSPNGGAVLAGLQVGDELSEVDGKTVTSLTAVGDLLQARQPGDWISIDIQRAMQQLSVQAQLQHDPGQQFEKTEFLDGRTGQVSHRRSGFQSVLQHNIALEPTTCGGPLLDIDGHIVAINIARRARESTLAMPMEDVMKAAKRVE